MVYHNNTLNDSSSVNYEEEEAREWRQPRSQQKNDDYITSTLKRMPDEVWLIPPNIDVKLVLGDRKINMSRIEESTNTHMSYNEVEGQIEMWGTRHDLDQAMMQWNMIAQNIHDEQIKTRTARKVKGWARPEKALTEKQIRKLQRREAREKEGQNLKCFPKIDLPFSSHFYFPDREIPISRIIGEKDEFLDPIRVQTKCYMWYDPQNHMVRVVGDDEDNAYEAISRVKNLYLKVFLARNIPIKRGWIYHMIEQPRMPYKVRIADPPNWLIPPYDSIGFFKVLEPVVIDEQPNNDTKIEIFDVHSENVKRIEDAILKALQTVYLFDEEIKMRIRFGQICLTYFPKDKSSWSIDRLNNLVLKDTRLQSRFTTCLTTDYNQFKQLEEYFTNDQVWENSSFHEFKIYASRRPIKYGEQRWTCAFDVSFSNGKIGLWNAVTNEKNVLEINMACLDYGGSWRLSIKTAKRLSIDKFGPQGVFVYKLRLSTQNHLVYTNTEDVVVISVCEKHKKKFLWKDDFIIEITRYEYWNCEEKFLNISPGVEILLQREPSENVSFGVTLYKKSWDDDFSANGNLNSGEVPEWYPDDISGGVKPMLDDINDFLKVLQDSNVIKSNISKCDF
ncbi:24319_t:CDS:10 [Gigaspora margarita]|uniref:24319_t:CDS:1 n=1 Tax=Gigaspora margarita TaxID=4874 RepID=A0ABN7VUF9_GIGMA|nr:24319_t:CDS:10 [Gigaspora margarita]